MLFRVVLLVEFVENPEGLRFGEDADRFDGAAALVGPAAFFWATEPLPDFVDGDGGWFTFVFGVVVVPLSEAFSALDWGFSCPGLERVHLKTSWNNQKGNRNRISTTSTGWRSWFEIVIVHKEKVCVWLPPAVVADG